MAVVDFGQPNTMRLVLKQDGDKLTGALGNQRLEGTFAGGDLTFKVGSREASGKLVAGRLAGQVTQGGRALEWSAERLAQRPATARTHTFEPTKFELYFTSRVDPVLRIAPGDTVKTWSVGADGVDAKGERRSPGGNPQTGPFYVEGAMPGDTLVVRVNRLRTNRSWAVSGDALETSMDIEFTVDLIEGGGVGHPLFENAEYLISLGVGGNLDQALQMATSGMMRWLQRDYKLDASEASVVMGFAMKYDVADLVGTQVSIAAKLPKSALAKLRKAS